MRSVLITGASTGFGYGLARRLDSEGWRVFAGVRSERDAQHLRAILSVRSEPLRLDVTDAEQIAAAHAHVAAVTGGRLDALVNNAGIVFHAPVECLTVAGVRRQFDVNVIGVFAVTQAFLPLVRAARGRIVIVGSISGRVAWPLNGVYAASKHAVRGFAESLRMEQRAYGVRVILIEPGAFATAIWSKYTPHEYLDLARLEPHVARHGAAAMRILERAMRTIGASAPAPDACVRTIERAITARRPRARYAVGADLWLQEAFARIPPALKDPLIGLLLNRVLDRGAAAAPTACPAPQRPAAPVG